MKVGLKLFLPMLSEAVGASELELDFDGSTVDDLLRHLIRRYGRRAREALYDKTGTLDLEVQVLVNKKSWVTRENLDTPLCDGDHVTIMVLMAGG